MTTRAAIDRWPLVGRWDELAAFDHAVTTTSAGGIVLFGPAGVGKTRLGDEVCARFERAGRRTRRAVASASAASTPFGALAHLLPADVMRAAASRDDAATLFERALAAFAADEGPSLLVIDDAHLLDATSLSFVSQLVVNGLVFVIATVRTGEPTPKGLDTLVRASGVERLELHELARADVDTLLHLALGGPVSGSTGAALWNASQGNVLYLRELVLSNRRSGALHEVDGVWSLDGPLTGTGRLRDMLAERLRDVDATAMPVLETIACCQRVALDHALEIAPFAALEDLERAGLLTLVDDDRRRYVAFSHPLYGELVRASLGELRVQRLLTEQAARVERDGARRRDDPLAIAGWLLTAGRPVDAGILVRAARLARYAHDFGGVERLALAALRAEPSAEAASLLGEALYEQGSFADAETVLAEAEARCTSEGDTDRVAINVASVRSVNLLWGLQRADDAVEVLERARAAARLASTTDLLLPAEAGVVLLSGRPAEALALLDAHPASADPRARVARAIPEASALASVGRTKDAFELARRSYDEHVGLGDVIVMAHPGVHVVTQAAALAEMGTLDEALTLAQAVHAMAVESGVAIPIMWATSMLGRIAMFAGRIATARRWFTESAALAKTTGFQGVRRLALSGSAACAAMLGDADAGAAVLGEISPLAGERTFGAPELWIGPAWTAVACHEPERARDLCLAGADEAARTGYRVAEARLLHDLARLGAPDVATARLAELATACDSDMVAARAQHAAALATHDPAGLADVTERFAKMGANLVAAEAATAAADDFRRAAQPRRATAMAERAAALRVLCEGARTPGLMSADTVVPLTRREREIATLAADGLSSKEIGARLYLSARTIDNHLQRVYTKLGVSRRAELSAALVQREEGP